MGANFCTDSNEKSILSLSQTSGVYLCGPENITKSQIQRSGEFKISQSANQFLGLSDTSVILGCKQDQNRQLMNKYVLTYLYFLKNKVSDSEVEIQDFIRLLKILNEDGKYSTQIQNFQSEYLKKPSPRQKAEFLISEYFKNGFFSSAIQHFPVYSFDPSVLAYARRPIVDLNKGIKAKYQKQSKSKEIYCVIQVTKDQQKLVNKMANQSDYFTFSTFVRCFSSEEKAKKRQKQLEKIGKSVRQTHQINPSTLFFNIQIPNEQVDKDYDYGFYKDETQKDSQLGDIIMNILNFFQVTGAQPQTRSYDLKYNSLARLVHLRRARLLQTEPQLLKVTSLIEGQCQQIKSHSRLIRLVTGTRLSITASQTLKNAIVRNSVTEDNERINLIEAYLEEKDYDKALQECKDSLQFKVRKAQVYYESRKQEEAECLIREIQPQKNILKTDHFTEYVLFELISAKIKKNKGEKKTAEKQLRSLSDQMKKEYRGTYEYRGREVQKEIADCEGVKQSGVDWERYADGLNVNMMLSH